MEINENILLPARIQMFHLYASLYLTPNNHRFSSAISCSLVPGFHLFLCHPAHLVCPKSRFIYFMAYPVSFQGCSNPALSQIA